MPYKSIVKYYKDKDKKLFNWLNKDAGSVMGKENLPNSNNSIVEVLLY